MHINIVLLFSVLFLFSELAILIVKKTKHEISKTKKDSYSLLLFWLAIPISITLGFMNAKYEVWNLSNTIVALVGLGVSSVGFALRWAAIYQLKKEFTVDVTITKEHKLQTKALYSLVRHPSYSGLILIVFGMALAMNNLISLAVTSIPIFLALLYRIKVEERVLLKAFPRKYRDYMKNTKRLIPYIY